jgi:hypothetical protein
MLRNLGGAVGTATLATVLTKREQFHSNIIGQSVTLYREEVRQRITEMTNYFLSLGVSDPAAAQHQAIVALGNIVKRQALIPPRQGRREIGRPAARGADGEGDRPPGDEQPATCVWPFITLLRDKKIECRRPHDAVIAAQVFDRAVALRFRVAFLSAYEPDCGKLSRPAVVWLELFQSAFRRGTPSSLSFRVLKRTTAPGTRLRALIRLRPVPVNT